MAKKIHVKTCVTCSTRGAPLWRDAEDGSPLCKTCGIRKLMKPQKSAAHQDPRFRGVHFWLNTEVRGQHSQLQISAYFSKVKQFNEKLTRKRHNSGCPMDSHSSSEAEENIVSYAKEAYFAIKTCASCGTRRTPLWRDAEDGTPLCNACGIRYKKYKVRCGHCWTIPKKDLKTYPNCPTCGALLRLPFTRRT